MHPNIVSVHDFGETATFYYLIMDFVDGECLSARIAKFGRIDVADTVNMLIQLCDGLSHAHTKGILHRDLKPSNVMLVNQGDRPDLVKLVDFGIAKSLNQTEEKMQLTLDGETIGSPLYMSPEQCRGEALDTRSDIYSLGCLAYKALTGVTPFTGKNHFEIYIKHTQEMPAPFAEVAGAARVPGMLERVLFKCLAKEPDARFSSMLELKSALEEVQ
jgi:serine/threonine-protein kinase